MSRLFVTVVFRQRPELLRDGKEIAPESAEFAVKKPVGEPNCDKKITAEEFYRPACSLPLEGRGQKILTRTVPGDPGGNNTCWRSRCVNRQL